jgi:hypothetical protein
MYQQREGYDNSTVLAMKLLEEGKGEDADYIDELYSVIADNCYLAGDPDEGIKWLDKILKESKNDELIEYTKNTKKTWLEQRDAHIK